jgi:hypothetical protein
VFLSDGSSKALQKTSYKKIVSKSFYQKTDKKSQTGFFSILFYHVFGRFSARGVKKHSKNLGKKSDPPPPWYFFGLRGTNQPRGGWGSVIFFLARPLVAIHAPLVLILCFGFMILCPWPYVLWWCTFCNAVAVLLLASVLLVPNSYPQVRICNL